MEKLRCKQSTQKCVFKMWLAESQSTELSLQIPTSFHSFIRKRSSIWIRLVLKIFFHIFLGSLNTQTTFFFQNKGLINYILESVPLWKVKINMQCQQSSQLWKVNMKTRQCYTSRWWGSGVHICTRGLACERRRLWKEASARLSTAFFLRAAC